jgi:hypothetical protein
VLPHTTPSPWVAQVNTGTLLVGSSTVSCASATVCYATAETESLTGAAFLVSINAGHTWTLRSAPAGLFFLEGDSLSCPQVSTCYLATFSLFGGGQGIFLTHNGGTSWTALHIPSGAFLSDISCRSNEDCIAGGQSSTGAVALVTTNDGATWTSHAGPAEATFEGVTCPSASDCYAVGQVETAEQSDALAATSSNGGSTWHVVALPATQGALIGIACPSTAECVAVGGVEKNTGIFALAFATYDTGARWIASTLPKDQGPFDGAACPTTSDCVGTSDSPIEGPEQVGNGAAALRSGNGGRGWLTAALPNSGPAGNVACPTTSACVASQSSSGGSDRLLTSSSDGSTWASSTEPAGAAMFGVSCSSTTACAAVGEADTEASTETTTNGSTWQTNPVPNFVALEDVSCATGTTDCYAIAANAAGDDVFAISPNSGVSWRAGNNFGATNAVDSLDCPAAGDCYLLMSSSTATTFLEATTTGGATAGSWQALTVLGGARQDGGATLSCPSTTECVVVELTGEITTTTDSGANWTVATMPGGIEEINALSCGATTTCVAVGLTTSDSIDTLVSTDGGVTFNLGGKLSSKVLPEFIACSDASSCELLGAVKAITPTSFATSNTAHTWTSQTAPTALGADGEWGPASCPAPGRCEAVSLTQAGSGEIFGLG